MSCEVSNNSIRIVQISFYGFVMIEDVVITILLIFNSKFVIFIHQNYLKTASAKISASNSYKMGTVSPPWFYYHY